jgi:hypothetical protein
MSLPEVRVIRERIESCKHYDIRMYLKAVYLFGARAVELTGKRCSGEKNLIYGPKGTDSWQVAIDPPDIPSQDLAMILLNALGDRDTALRMIEKYRQNIPIALYKIKIAKQKLDEGEEAPYRIIALPLPKEYEPWSQDVFDYFQRAGDNYVFPFNRSYVWDYITHEQQIFKGLTYRIKKYNYNRVGQPIFKVLPHPRKIKIHGLRHVRIDELIGKYYFDALDMVAFVGWKLTKSGPQGGAAPAMADVYAEIREAWHRYIKKLCKVVS